VTRIHELISAAPVRSVEFFPPRTPEGVELLERTVAELAPTGLSFVSVTYGAGGSTRELTRDIVVGIQREQPFPAMPHLTCMAHTKEELTSLLDDYFAHGIENVLALGGDPPADGSPARGDFTYASELIELVRSRGDVSVGVAAFPEGHPRAPSLESDRRYLAAKLSAADFGISQFFFDADHYFRMLDDLARLGCETPVLPGVMPLANPTTIRRFATINGTTFPEDLAARVDAATGQDRHRIVVDAAVELSARLVEGGAPGLHFYCLNRSEVVLDVLAELA
jgi:methylenetetrahydrofolate reductase (NADPH)